MLRQIGTLPPEAQGCFHDYMTGDLYTCVQGQLQKCNSKSGNHPIHLPMNISGSAVSPESYLHKLIIVEGNIALNTQGTIATSKTSAICTVRSTKALCDRACWQFHVPGSLYGIELGICQLSTNGALKYLSFTFNSSTSRTVTFLVDNMELKAWVNETSHHKKNSKPIEWELSSCYPYAKITMQGLTVVFNSLSVEPNSKISSFYNPFNTLTSSEIKTPSVTQNEAIPQARLVDVKQLNKNKFLLIAEGNIIKII